MAAPDSSTGLIRKDIGDFPFPRTGADQGSISTRANNPQDVLSEPPSASRSWTPGLAANPSSQPWSEKGRPSNLSSSTTLASSPSQKSETMIPQITFNPWEKRNQIFFSVSILLFFDLILPCALYYPLQYKSHLSNSTILGIACLSLGLGELAELPLRGYRLFKHPSDYLPLGQTSRWAFDSLFWYYTLATIVAVIPYVFATDLDEPIYWLFLMTPGILAIFCAIPLLLTIYPFRLPFRISSDARGVPVKPAVYYIVEDFVAVDAGQGRAFRVEWKARYDSSPIMRRMVWEMNLFWAFGCFVFTGALAGITWAISFDAAYGVSFGLLFVWIGVWTYVTWLRIRRAQRMELEWCGTASSD